MVNEIPKYFSTPEIRIDCENDFRNLKIKKKSFSSIIIIVIQLMVLE